MLTGTTARSPRGTIEVAVLIGGQPQPLYRRPGDGALFTAGAEGQAYTLRVRNLTSARAEVISTVDGRNTLKDEPGDPQQNRGLVFAANSSGDFTGWRLNADQTRQFIFGTPGRSVAAQATGSQANTGVIGFAAWREWISPDVDLRARYMPVAFAGPAIPDSAITLNSATTATRGLGTGIGAAQDDHVGSTSFTRTDAADILVIGYDTREALDAMGITGPAGPSAFPGAGTGYEKYAGTLSH